MGVDLLFSLDPTMTVRAGRACVGNRRERGGLCEHSRRTRTRLLVGTAEPAEAFIRRVYPVQSIAECFVSDARVE